MYKFLNPVLLILIICILLWRAVCGMGSEAVDSRFDAIFLSCTATLCVIHLLLGVSRLLTGRTAGLQLLWCVSYMMVACVALVSVRTQAAPYTEQEYESYREAYAAWRRGGDPMAQNADGETLLTLAAAMGRCDVLEHVLERNPVPSEQKLNAAQMAASRNYTECLQLLLEKGEVEADALHEGTTLLCCAAQNGQVAATRALLKAGCNPNVADEDGCTPLMHAVMAQHVGVVRLLLESGADPALTDAQGRDAASYNSRTDIEDLLSAAVMPND